jgi:leader peptidase (prepilin peptidase)/N-methyltransferase
MGVAPDAETRAVLRADAVPIVVAAVLGAVLVAVRLGAVPLLPAALGFVLLAAPLAFLDARLHRLPDALTLPGYPFLLVLLIPAAATSPAAWLRAVLAAALCAGGYLLLVLLGGAGLGDVKAAGLVGLLLGTVGWRSVLAGTVFAFLLAAGWAVALLVLRRAHRRSHLAFGPFLLGGALLALLTQA